MSSSTLRQRDTDTSSSAGASASASASASTSASPPSPSSPSASTHDGFTDEGESFKVPDTLSTVSIFHPKNIGLVGVSIILLTSFSLYCVIFMSMSKWFNVTSFMIARCAYNIGLGVILSRQSRFRSFTKIYTKIRGSGTGVVGRLLDQLALEQLPGHIRTKINIASYPAAFRAWLVYKNLVTFILCQDGFQYLILGLKCFHLPQSSSPDVAPGLYSFFDALTPLILAQYALGIGLALFNYWAKVDAHRCIGEYCWYWGDFFFRRNLNLTFDGIFELFPHPMYTVGYSFYYGYSLICRSYTMFFVSLLAHALQIGFLFFVEEPHIERTYGTPASYDKNRLRILYDPKEGWFPGRNDSIFFVRIDMFRSADLALIMLVVYAVYLCCTMSDPLWLVLHVVLWRGVHWFGLGYALYAQSTRQAWTKHFTRRGRPISEAFAEWKRTYNISITMNVIVFIGCALRFIHISASDFASPSFCARLLVGVLFVLLNIWSCKSTYDSVGDFGWFYGDFFVEEDAFQQHLCYTGIYRFLNNPDCVTGYLGHYGLALISGSWVMWGLAVSGHMFQILFLALVEIPHMRRLYRDKVRHDTPVVPVVESAIKGAIKGVTRVVPKPVAEQADILEEKVKAEMKRIRLEAMKKAYEVYEKYKKRRASTSAQIAQLKCVDACVLGSSLSVDYDCSSNSTSNASNDNDNDNDNTNNSNGASALDWIGIYPIDVPSMPGASQGKWMYVNEGSLSGTVTFPPNLMPSSEGVYAVRYHRNNSYIAVSTRPLIVYAPGSSPEEIAGITTASASTSRSSSSASLSSLSPKSSANEEQES